MITNKMIKIVTYAGNNVLIIYDDNRLLKSIVVKSILSIEREQNNIVIEYGTFWYTIQTGSMSVLQVNNLYKSILSIIRPILVKY